MKKYLVTISIPTYNSARTLELCLAAVNAQTYRNIEINIVDKYSKDETIKIARKYQAKIIFIEGSLLQARYQGAKEARGEFVLLLDSDQILEKDAIERALDLMNREKHSMLAFEETTYRKTTFLELLFNLDRKLINNINDLNPFTGVIMPRFFIRNLLLRAYEKIPKEIFPHTGGPDHAIVYFEAWKIDKRVGVLPRAVKHLEPASFGQLIPKFFRWGYTGVNAKYGKYHNLMAKKERFRTGMFKKGLILESIASMTLLVIKGIPYKIGYLLGRVDKALGINRYK